MVYSSFLNTVSEEYKTTARLLFTNQNTCNSCFIMRLLRQIKPWKCLLIHWDMLRRRHPFINTTRLRTDHKRDLGSTWDIGTSYNCRRHFCLRYQLLLYQKTRCLLKECRHSWNSLCTCRPWEDIDSTWEVGSHYTGTQGTKHISHMIFLRQTLNGTTAWTSSCPSVRLKQFVA